MTGVRTPLGSGVGHKFAPNASTDCVRPKSSLSHHGFDGQMDEEDVDDNQAAKDFPTPTPRRTTLGSRVSDVGSAIPSPNKRLSVGPSSKLPTPARRQSGIAQDLDSRGEMRRPQSRHGNLDCADPHDGYDRTETF